MIINGQTINDPLANIQQDVMAILRGNPALAWTPIYTFKDFVVQAVEDQNVSIWKDISGQGKRGIAIEIRMPALYPKYPNVPGPQQMLELTLRIMEDPVQNNTGTTCESIALEVQRWLDGLVIFAKEKDVVYTLRPDGRAKSLTPVYEYADRYAYDVVMTSELPQDARVRCPTPEWADDGNGNVTFTDPSGIASIYYTLDGSVPIIPVPNTQPAAPTQFYQGTFAAPDGACIAWLAWREGALPSDLARGVIKIDGVPST